MLPNTHWHSHTQANTTQHTHTSSMVAAFCLGESALVLITFTTTTCPSARRRAL